MSTSFLENFLVQLKKRSNFVIKQLIIISCVFFTFSCAHTDHNNHSASATNVLPEYVFSSEANLPTKVAQTLQVAASKNQKALLVLGAQWCHDSKGLAMKFSTPEMQKILSKNYQTLFIDVGYLEKGFDIVKKFNLPVYYGTPTVLVIDPNSTEILNRASMQKWLSADRVKLADYIEYFDKFAENSVEQSNNESGKSNTSMQKYLNQINDFEQQQATRLKSAYAIVGPLLQQYMESENKKASGEFSSKWEEVRSLRYRIQDDIQVLSAQAKQNIKAGTKQPLVFPNYPAFSWE